MTVSKNIIDGERKAVIVPASTPGMSRFEGLLRRSQWSKAKKATLYTMRALEGATLRDQGLEGQLPPVGYEFPTALLKGRGDGRTGKQMDAKLAVSKAEAKAGRSAIKALNVIKNAIL